MTPYDLHIVIAGHTVGSLWEFPQLEGYALVVPGRTHPPQTYEHWPMDQRLAGRRAASEFSSYFAWCLGVRHL